MRKERKGWDEKMNSWGTLSIVPHSKNNFALLHSSLTNNPKLNLFEKNTFFKKHQETAAEWVRWD